MQEKFKTATHIPLHLLIIPLKNVTNLNNSHCLTNYKDSHNTENILHIKLVDFFFFFLTIPISHGDFKQIPNTSTTVHTIWNTSTSSATNASMVYFLASFS